MSLYDYFQDILVNGLQNLVDSKGKNVLLV